MSKPTTSKRTLLAQAREERGWTQAYVAEQVGVTVDAVRRWEADRHLPYQKTIQKLCVLFCMTPRELGLLKEQDTPHSLTREEIDECSFLQNIQDTWEPNEEEKKAAWEIYVELVTRIPIAVLGQDEGILREALSSMYSLFHITRMILRSHSPAIAQGQTGDNRSVSYLVVRMLNTILRPLLAKWHPLLKAYEETRPGSVSVTQYERQWERCAELRQEIIEVRKGLTEYAHIFAQIAEVSSLLIDTSEITSQGVLVH